MYVNKDAQAVTACAFHSITRQRWRKKEEKKMFPVIFVQKCATVFQAEMLLSPPLSETFSSFFFFSPVSLIHPYMDALELVDPLLASVTFFLHILSQLFT